MALEWEKVKLVYELPSGGRVEVTDESFEPMGEAFTYRQCTYRGQDCEVVFEVRGGVPGAVSINLRAGEGFIRQKDLTDIRLDHLRDEAYNAVGMFIPDPEGGHEATHMFVRKALGQVVSRKKITRDFLRRVANVYYNAPAGARAETVATVFDGCSTRQAWRYIAQAKQEGFIEND